MKKIKELFDVRYGVNLELNALTICSANDKYAVNFISRTANNNGLAAIVERRADIEPTPAGTLTVAGGGTVLETFLQNKPYYSGRDLFCLTPKVEMSDEVKLYYCACIRANKYRYDYGRQANKTLRDIKIPDISEIPDFVKNAKIPDYSYLTKPICEEKLEINFKKWKYINLTDYFNMYAGRYYPEEYYSCGPTPYISTKDFANGVMDNIDIVPDFKRGSLTIGKVGCITFYQEKDFCATSDVTVLTPKFTMNKYIGMFFIGIINLEKHKWGYGRQIRLEDCKKLRIGVPVNSDNTPDFEFMERYIKSTPYSAGI